MDVLQHDLSTRESDLQSARAAYAECSLDSGSGPPTTPNAKTTACSRTGVDPVLRTVDGFRCPAGKGSLFPCLEPDLHIPSSSVVKPSS